MKAYPQGRTNLSAFSLDKRNATLIENCTDPEKCASFTENGNSNPIQIYDTLEKLGIKCHKDFLRYIS